MRSLSHYSFNWDNSIYQHVYIPSHTASWLCRYTQKKEIFFLSNTPSLPSPVQLGISKRSFSALHLQDSVVSCDALSTIVHSLLSYSKAYFSPLPPSHREYLDTLSRILNRPTLHPSVSFSFGIYLSYNYYLPLRCSAKGRWTQPCSSRFLQLFHFIFYLTDGEFQSGAGCCAVDRRYFGRFGDSFNHKKTSQSKNHYQNPTATA